MTPSASAAAISILIDLDRFSGRFDELGAFRRVRELPVKQFGSLVLGRLLGRDRALGDSGAAVRALHQLPDRQVWIFRQRRGGTDERWDVFLYVFVAALALGVNRRAG